MKTGGLSGRSVKLLPLIRVRDDEVEPVTDRCIFRPGDRVYYAWTYREGAGAGEWLTRHGWQPAVDQEGAVEEDPPPEG